MSTDQKGMTLRDHFATTALPLAIEYWRKVDEDEEDEGSFDWDPDRVTEDCRNAADLAYRMADAMMLARKGKAYE